MKSTIETIKSIIDADNDWGVRTLPEESPRSIGSKLQNSYNWIDNVRTESMLLGTSAIGITVDSLDNIFLAGEYVGDVVALIKGRAIGSGDDQGEVLLKKAEIVAIFDKKDFILCEEEKISFADFVTYKGKNFNNYNFEKMDSLEWKTIVDEFRESNQDELKKLVGSIRYTARQGIN